ncbi:VWA domain-containing protein [Propionibacterium freudenreichii]|uniref:VWA domain-containing protein n=1 Tax=Propionibacterium freudenreichii TaxID=1744 RepID=UPI000762C0F0|nr:VWA domain-containing protein [Propionibacterium freudenreichii]
MGVMWWWLGAAVLVALVGVGLLRLLGRPRRSGQDESALWLAHAERLRALPRFRQLAAARARWARIGLVGLALAALGTGLLAARVIRVSNGDELMRNRDVMLCLDVSPSMEGIDVPVVDTYQRLSQRLDSERIGLVAFDSGAVTLFPLTSDAGFVQARLTDAGRQVADLERNPIAGTRVGDSGSSLVGDGLTSCVRRFDQLDQPRSRTIVLATDGLVSGNAIYSIQQAAEAARDKQVMVFVVAPDNDDAEALTTLRNAAHTTGGEVLTVQAGQPANTQVIAQAVEAQQRAAILSHTTNRSFDRPGFGAGLVCLGLAIVTISEVRRPGVARGARGGRR